jgi:hypothetical protein
VDELEDAPVLAGVIVPLVLLAVSQSALLFFLPLGVNFAHDLLLALADLPLAFAESALAAGMVLPEGVVPVAGGVDEGPVGVLAEAPVVAALPPALPDAELPAPSA